MFEVDSVVHGFRLLRREWIEEVQANALELVHEKTGAQVIVLSTEDDNKTFCITFRTPPEDDTGLPHILEHSVLNGSRKYPVKEPFAELLKASLYTFLNAMTYPDKTVYPVSSRNDQDFQNLMDVYLDAVFHPNLTEQTFMQEGWHYEITRPDADLQYSGVVYNEMLGATSSPESVLVDELESALYPDNVYGRKSGGKPEAIPELTYEQFCEFHRQYYHPSNSRTVLYGDFDVAERLAHLAEFLDDYDRLEIDSAITPHPRFTAPVTADKTYPITPGSETENKAYVLRAWSMAAPTDPETHLALTILTRILTGTPASPLRKALIDSHLGEDVQAWHNRDILDTYYAVGLKGTEAERRPEIIGIIEATLARLVRDGLDQRTVEAAVNSIEFRLREANFGGLSKGLIYALQMDTAWLYDADPLTMLKYEAPLAAVRAKAAAGGFFEELIREHLIDNRHYVDLTLTPDEAFEEQRLQQLRDRLAAEKTTFDAAAVNDLIAACDDLRQAQLRPDSPEALATIPKLPLNSIDREAEVYPFETVAAGPPVTFAEQPTNGIAYLKVVFDARVVPQDLLQYVPFFTQVSLQAGTARRDFVEMTEEIGIQTGGIGAGYTPLAQLDCPDDVFSLVAYSGKCLQAKLPQMIEILAEIFRDCRLDDVTRLREIARAARAGMESRVNNAGHSFVVTRLAAGQSVAGKYAEMTGGLEYFYFLDRLVRDLESDPAAVIDRLNAVRNCLFRRAGVRVHLTAGRDELNALTPLLPQVWDSLTDNIVQAPTFDFPNFNVNEGLMIPSKVQYVGKGLNLFAEGLQRHGAFAVLKKLLGRDYLWNKVRVQGNAYGCFCSLDSLTGHFYCCSYRDPNLEETLAVFDAIADYLETLDLPQDDFEKLLIGTMGGIDSPHAPDQKGAIAFNRHITGVSQDLIQREREQTLNCTVDDLRGYAGLLRRFAEKGQICVVGGEEKVQSCRAEFDRIRKALVADEG